MPMSKLGAGPLEYRCLYYSGFDESEDGVEYKKVSIPGRVIPERQSVEEIFDFIDEFLSRRRANSLLREIEGCASKLDGYALGPFGDPLPEIPCLCLEVFLCPQMAVSANRFFTQSRFGLMNTPADNALVEAANCLAAVANCAVCFMELKGCCQQCFQIDLDGPCLDIQLPELILLADFAYLCLNGCMYAQQQAEIDAMQSRGYGGAPQALLAVLPQKMQALMANARPPQQQFMMPDMFVAIHCTHGVNRTGFVVAAYLMTRGDQPEHGKAVKAFEKARGHKMNKDYLIQALKQLEEGQY
eukprot:s1548_g1.t1